MADGTTPAAAGNHQQVSPGDGFTVPELLEQISGALEQKNPDVALELIAAAQAKTEESEASPSDHLIGRTGYCSIHNATCMLEYMTELASEYRAESSPHGDDADNHIYGAWLLNL